MKLTLEEIDAIYRNKTEYHIVFYKDDKEFRYVREDIDKARSLLNYNPEFSMEKGLKEAVSWYWDNL